MVGLNMFLHCINLDYPNLTCQLRPRDNDTIIQRNYMVFNTVFLVRYCLHIAYHTTEVKLMLMGNSKNLPVFNFANLLKSRKFDAREYTCFIVLYIECLWCDYLYHITLATSEAN